MVLILRVIVNLSKLMGKAKQYTITLGVNKGKSIWNKYFIS